MGLKEIKIGIIGTGVGLRTYLPAFQEMSGVDVFALAGRNEERTAEFAEIYDIKNPMNINQLCISPEIDLVCVTSPNIFHQAQTAMALEAGKHVICEKPLAMNLEETHQLIQIAERKLNQLALVNHQLRFNPYLKKVKELVDAGKIGRPYFIRMHQQSIGFSDRKAPWSWSFDADEGGGVRLAMGSHLIDLIHFWFGTGIETVTGSMDPVVHKRKNVTGQEVQIRASSFFSASLEFTGGLSAHISATAAACSTPGFEFSIFGDSGELHFNLEDKLRGAFENKRGKIETIEVFGVNQAERENRVSIFSGSFPYYANEIVRSLRQENGGNLCDAAKFKDALNTQIVLDALECAANTGTMQRLSGHQRHLNLI